ncbi:anti-anti-sigma regulatory factor [Bacillus sp. SORGH_AS 510]|uniref:ATP-binding protein n=1 Tax=Bacillus sp. SORGH_AS_0510 TaxID=3041771 RepID=UPI002787197A|nr:ATP-binding protein [Bacillus sp. SORGH_AS_0510]MDQ1145953.1 anti-anti-sigma regulatory factor [Bacillus sp. SORGH_AS_0510]
MKEKIHDQVVSDNHLSQLASVGQIAAGIAHEVRNPLTAVKGFLQLLEQDQKEDYIRIAQSELENALTTLNNLLQVSKPDQEEEEMQSFSVVIELESILNLFQNQFYNVEIMTNFRDADAKFHGKKSQFKKAFFNLIKNAFESMESKGTLIISHYASSEELVVTIEDTGVGIPDEKLNLLGTPFFTTKDHGTGMGLTQVFSVIYQHGGKVVVKSKEKIGTKFTIRLPKQFVPTKRGVKRLELNIKDNCSVKDFFILNRDQFEVNLLGEAINVKDKIEEIRTIGNTDLLNNAHRLVMYVVEEREHELILFAKQEGVSWAKHSLTIAFKLEWVQAIRRTLWDFLYNYETLTNLNSSRENFYTLEKNTNQLIDQFLNYFFISYTKYRDELLDTQRKLVENLSVPIIPLSKEVCILPLIGNIDMVRMNTIEDKVLNNIERTHIQTLIIDFSGVAQMDEDVINYLIKIINGINMMGCKSVLTGLRAENVKLMIRLGLSIDQMVEYKGTLQIALKDFVSV